MNASRCGVLAVLAAVVAVATGLVCQYPPCNLVKCNPVDPDKCTGTIQMGGGYCGCCKECFTYMGPGEWCESKGDLLTSYYPPTVLCKTGLYCQHNTSTCEPIPGFNIG